MTTILVPFHQDERLPDDVIPLHAEEVVAPALPEGGLWPRLVALYDAVADTVAAHVAPDTVPTVVSGDCLVALGTIAGTQRAGLDPAVVWFDAHGDVHTAQTSTSGYLGGMSLRLVLGAHAERMAEPLGLRPPAERRAVLVDARDLDPAEADFLSTSEITRHRVADIGPATVPDGPIVLHIDVDVIDPGELPGLKFPAPDGPSTHDVLRAVRRVLDTGRVVAVDIACPWEAARDDHETTIRARLLAELLTPPTTG